MDEIKLPVNNELAHRQPATFETNFYNNVEINLKKLLKIFNYIYNFQFPIRLSDIRVSPRILRYSMTLKTFMPLYNNITSEVNLEKNLYFFYFAFKNYVNPR